MKKCTKCGNENSDIDRFCRECGASLDGEFEDVFFNKPVEQEAENLQNSGGGESAQTQQTSSLAVETPKSRWKKVVIPIFAVILIIALPFIIMKCLSSTSKSYGEPKTYYFRRYYGGGDYMKFDGHGKCYSGDVFVGDYYIQNGKYYVNVSKGSICLTIVKDGVIADMNGKEASSNSSKWNAPTEITFRNNNSVLFLHSNGSFRVDKNDIPCVWGQYYLNQGVVTLLIRQAMSDDYRITNPVGFSYCYIYDDGEIYQAGVEDLAYYSQQH